MKMQEKPKEEKVIRIRKISIWKISAALLAVLFIISLVTKGFTGFASSSPQKTTEKTVEFIKNNFMQPGVDISIVSAEEEKGLYKSKIAIDGQLVDLYITKDGTLFFPQAIDTTKDIPFSGGTQPPSSTTPIEVSVDDDPVKGEENAPITIVEFSDFQCPFCERFFKETLPQIEKEYIETGKVKLVYRDFPLREIHSDAQKAAEAAECADEQGKFWEYHNMLFENQEALKIADLKEYAVTLKLDTQEFNNCLDKSEKAEEVNADSKEGESYGVTGTPAFFINGILVSGARPFEDFQAIIEEELSKTG